MQAKGKTVLYLPTDMMEIGEVSVAAKDKVLEGPMGMPCSYDWGNCPAFNERSVSYSGRGLFAPFNFSDPQLGMLSSRVERRKARPFSPEESKWKWPALAKAHRSYFLLGVSTALLRVYTFCIIFGLFCSMNNIYTSHWRHIPPPVPFD